MCRKEQLQTNRIKWKKNPLKDRLTDDDSCQNREEQKYMIQKWKYSTKILIDCFNILSKNGLCWKMKHATRKVHEMFAFRILNQQTSWRTEDIENKTNFVCDDREYAWSIQYL